MNLKNSEIALLNLVSCGAGICNDVCLSELSANDWHEVFDDSERQGVSAVCVDGFNALRPVLPSDGTLEYRKLQWFGGVMQMEQLYGEHLSSIESLAKFYHSEGVKMMLLKGYGLSLDWPVPNHRPVGDIDIYLFDLWDFADQMLRKKLGIDVNKDHHHHTVFTFDGVTVENHYDFINVHSHRSNVEVESIFKKLAKERQTEYMLSNGVVIYLPSPILNALFLARHMGIHFAAEHLTLRQILDWALFVRVHHEEVDWNLFWENMKQMNMHKFVLSVNAICCEYLGFDKELFYTPMKYKNFAVESRTLVERVLMDVLHPADGDLDENEQYTKQRLRLWWKNRWKHRIVYSDSLFSTFFAQIKSHLMKPSTIFHE